MLVHMKVSSKTVVLLRLAPDKPRRREEMFDKAQEDGLMRIYTDSVLCVTSSMGGSLKVYVQQCFKRLT